MNKQPLSFKDFGIKATSNAFQGEKVKIERVLNKEITVTDFKVVESKYEGKGQCLHLQIKLSNEDRVVFTGSGVLINQINQVGKEKLPFNTTIVRNGECFEFT